MEQSMNNFLSIDEKNSVFYLQVTVLGETIRLMGEVDGVIDVHGGWPMK